MNLSEIIAELTALRDSVKDRSPDDVDVRVFNPGAKSMADVLAPVKAVRLEAFESVPDGVSGIVWKKQVRILFH